MDKNGTWKQINDAFVVRLRTQAGKQESPSLVIIDSQSIKTTEIGSDVGYDGGKQINGRKRHIAVDTLGLLLLVVVTAASVQEANSAPFLEPKMRDRFPRLQKILVSAIHKEKFITWFLEKCHWVVEVAKRREGAKGFEVIPLRWVAERTFGWFNHLRRLSKDYEYHTEMSESMVYLASICIMLKRLSRRRSKIYENAIC